MKYFFTIVTMLCLFSCTDEKSIEGSWIYSYDLNTEGKISFSPISVAIFEFENDNLTEFVIGNQDYGIENQENVYSIEKSGNIYKLGEEYTLDLDSIKGDSIILKSADADNNVSIICKRLPTDYGLRKWKPFKKQYKFKNWKSESVQMEFITDSTFKEQKKTRQL